MQGAQGRRELVVWENDSNSKNEFAGVHNDEETSNDRPIGGARTRWPGAREGDDTNSPVLREQPTNFAVHGPGLGDVSNVADGGPVQLPQERPTMTKFCKHRGHRDKCGVCIGRAMSMARAATTEEVEAATLAAAIVTGNQRQQTTAETSQVWHGTVGCTISNSTRLVRLPYLLDNIDIQLQHNSHGENLGEELEGLGDGELPSQQHNGLLNPTI